MIRLILISTLLLAKAAYAEIIGPMNQNGFSYKVTDKHSYYNQKIAVESGTFLGDIEKPGSFDFPSYDSNITDHISNFLQEKTISAPVSLDMGKIAMDSLAAKFLEEVELEDVAAPEVIINDAETIFDCLSEIKNSYESQIKNSAVGVIDRDLEVIIESKRETPEALLCAKESRDGVISKRSSSFEYMMVKNLLDQSKGQDYFSFLKLMSKNSHRKALVEMRSFALAHNTIYLYQEGKLKSVTEMKTILRELVKDHSISIAGLDPVKDYDYLNLVIELL